MKRARSDTHGASRSVRARPDPRDDALSEARLPFDILYHQIICRTRWISVACSLAATCRRLYESAWKCERVKKWDLSVFHQCMSKERILGALAVWGPSMKRVEFRYARRAMRRHVRLGDILPLLPNVEEMYLVAHPETHHTEDFTDAMVAPASLARIGWYCLPDRLYRVVSERMADNLARAAPADPHDD